MDWVDGFWGMEACQQLIDLLQRERQRRPSGAEVVSASIFFFLCGLQSLQLFSLQDIMLPKYHFWGFKDWCKNYSQRFKGFLKHFIKDLINNMSTGETMRLTKCHKWAPLFPLVTVLPPLRCSSRMSPSSILHPPPPPPPSSSSILLLLFLLQQQLQKLWVSTTVHLFIFLATFLSEFASYWYCTVLYCLYYICTLLYFVPTAAKTISVFKKISCPVSWANKRSPWLNL